MPIDLDRIAAETFVARVEHRESLGSTNDRAAQCALEGAEPLPLLVLADRQTAGRGRGARRWWTGPGALAFSLLIEADAVGAAKGPSPRVALAAAVALVDAVEPLLPNHPPGIRWPNDVLADGRKLAGILIEALPDRRHVVGIGLNSNNTMADAPADLRPVATTLSDLAGQSFDQTEILIKLLKSLERRFDELRNRAETLVARADALCLQRGQILAFDQGGRAVEGRCRGIAADGALLMETPSGVVPIYSGTQRNQSP